MENTATIIAAFAAVGALLLTIGSIIYFAGKNDAIQKENELDITKTKKDISGIKGELKDGLVRMESFIKTDKARDEFVSKEVFKSELDNIHSELRNLKKTDDNILKTVGEISGKIDQLVNTLHNVPLTCQNFKPTGTTA